MSLLISVLLLRLDTTTQSYWRNSAAANPHFHRPKNQTCRSVTKRKLRRFTWETCTWELFLNFYSLNLFPEEITVTGSMSPRLEGRRRLMASKFTSLVCRFTASDWKHKAGKPFQVTADLKAARNATWARNFMWISHGTASVMIAKQLSPYCLSSLLKDKVSKEKGYGHRRQTRSENTLKRVSASKH